LIKKIRHFQSFKTLTFREKKHKNFSFTSKPEEFEVPKGSHYVSVKDFKQIKNPVGFDKMNFAGFDKAINFALV